MKHFTKWMASTNTYPGQPGEFLANRRNPIGAKQNGPGVKGESFTTFPVFPAFDSRVGVIMPITTPNRTDLPVVVSLRFAVFATVKPTTLTCTSLQWRFTNFAFHRVHPCDEV